MKLKAKIIIGNFIASWFGLAIDTEYTPIWICMTAILWFLVSGSLFLWAARRGYFRKIEKRFKIDEL